MSKMKFNPISGEMEPACSEPIKTTWRDLMDLRTRKLLDPGRQYRINYSASHNSGTVAVSGRAGFDLSLTAISEDSLVNPRSRFQLTGTIIMTPTTCRHGKSNTASTTTPHVSTGRVTPAMPYATTKSTRILQPTTRQSTAYITTLSASARKRCIQPREIRREMTRCMFMKMTISMAW